MIEADGRPLEWAYPEDMGENFGFRVRSATLAEIIWFEGEDILTRPLVSGFSLLFWTLAGWLISPLVWRRHRKATASGGWVAIMLGLLRVVCALLLGSVTLLWMGFGTGSAYSLGFFAFLGVFLALILTRPRQTGALPDKAGRRE